MLYMFFNSDNWHKFFKKHSTLFNEQIKLSKQEFLFIKSHPTSWTSGTEKIVHSYFCCFKNCIVNIFYVLIEICVILGKY